MPLRLDPGTMMKPKSKMKVFSKDDSMSDMHQSDGASALNKSARVATMLSHTKNATQQQLDEDVPGRTIQGIKHWGVSR